MLTLVPGVMGGSETYARELTKALARVGGLEYRVFVPPGAEDAAFASLKAVAENSSSFLIRACFRITVVRWSMGAPPGSVIGKEFTAIVDTAAQHQVLSSCFSRGISSVLGAACTVAAHSSAAGIIDRALE